MIDRDRLTRATVLAGSLSLYLATQPRAAYNSDVYDYIAAVRSGSLSELFHVHHLLFSATGRAWARLWAIASPGTGVDTVLRSLNGLLGALTVLAFHELLRRFLPRSGDRLAATALLATCFAIWMFSVDVEVYIASTLFLVAALVALWRTAQRLSLRGALLAGILLGLGALYHQMGALFSPVALLVLGTAPGEPRRRRAASAAVCVLSGGLIALVPYVAVGVIWHQVSSAGDFVRWILGYSLRGYGEGISARSLPMAVVGQGRSMVFFGFALRALQDPRASGGAIAALGLVALAGATFAAGAWGALRGWTRAERHLKAVWAPLLLWYAIYAVFTLLWEPENPEFWVTASIPFVALWAGGLALAGGRWRWLVWAAVAIAFPANLADLIARRDPGYDPEVRAVQQIAASAGADAVILPPAMVARAQTFAPGLRSIDLYHVLQRFPRVDSALQELRRLVAEERAAGRRVFLYEEAVSDRMRSIFPHADAVMVALKQAEGFEPRFTVELPYDPSGAFGTLARPRLIAIGELVGRGPAEP